MMLPSKVKNENDKAPLKRTRSLNKVKSVNVASSVVHAIFKGICEKRVKQKPKK